MKEIDFIPEWYKTGRRRQLSYRTQCVALGGMFVIMMAWNLISIRAISKATVELVRLAPEQSRALSVSREFKKVQSKLADLQKKTRLIKQIDSKIDVASVLAEMSFLIDDKIVLSKVEFNAQKFDAAPLRNSPSASVVRIASDGFGGKQAPLGNVRFQITISGVAAEPSDVAKLICKLEDSPYFFLVRPSFSRYKTIGSDGNLKVNSDVKAAKIPGPVKADVESTAKKYQVSEFEISCYLANYRQDENKY